MAELITICFMKVYPERLPVILERFPLLESVLDKLNAANIDYRIGGSVALYLQGNSREPHDVDVMFRATSHDEANALFGIEVQEIHRPNVSTRKSTPVHDGSIDFLSQYTVTAEEKEYHSPPNEKVDLTVGRKVFALVPAEKVVIFKLIGRRLHHHDLDDVSALMRRPDFDWELFWGIARQLNAQDVITAIASKNELNTPPV